MEDRETPRMHKYGEIKTTGIVMATVRHVTFGSGLRKFQADGFLFDWVYYVRLHVKCWLFSSDFNKTGISTTYFQQIPQIPNLMKIRPVGAELFHADRRKKQTWRR